MEMQGNATEIDERNLLQLDALLSHGYGLSPQLVMRSKGLSIEAKALYGYLSSFAGAGDTAFPSTSRILEELDISKNRFYKIRKELISWGFISIETTATSAGLRTVYTLPQNPIAIKTEIDEIANRRNEIKSSLVANLHNEDMVSHKGDSESERLQQLAGNEPCRQSEAKAQNRGSNLKPCLQSEDEGCLQSGECRRDLHHVTHTGKISRIDLVAGMDADSADKAIRHIPKLLRNLMRDLEPILLRKMLFHLTLSETGITLAQLDHRSVLQLRQGRAQSDLKAIFLHTYPPSVNAIC